MPNTYKQIPVIRAKRIVLDKIAAGATRKDAMLAVGRAVETYRDWQKNDADWAGRIESIRIAHSRGAGTAMAVPDFPEFSELYLRTVLPLHQLRAWDVLDGREPRGLHPAMQWQPGEEIGKFTILNFPPDHAKSTTWTVNWVT
ncbi:MAG: hypothetical protein ACREP9_18310, partial [Candidatus Dormibacteraceae bacterium]